MSSDWIVLVSPLALCIIDIHHSLSELKFSKERNKRSQLDIHSGSIYWKIKLSSQSGRKTKQSRFAALCVGVVSLVGVV